MSLPFQDFRLYNEIDYTDVMYLYDYHPWYRNGEKNPKIDQVTHDILNIKNAKPDKVALRNKAVRFFKSALVSKNPAGISSVIPPEQSLFAVVPSSTSFRVCEGLMELMLQVQAEFRFLNRENVLVRHTDVPKAATGGLRDQRVHLESINADQQSVRGMRVFLFDDVTTTGSSLLACRRILLESGASSVAMIALGKTIQD